MANAIAKPVRSDGDVVFDTFIGRASRHGGVW